MIAIPSFKEMFSVIFRVIAYWTITILSFYFAFTSDNTIITIVLLLTGIYFFLKIKLKRKLK